MNSIYSIQDTSSIFSPALVFYKDLIRRNIAKVIEMAGSVERLRPHAKTHKTREIARMELEAGITKHKCATVAEAEMLAGAGVTDVLLSYPIVGPNCGRMARLMQKFPSCRFSTLTDHPDAARALSEAMSAAGQKIDVLIDLDVGQHRTGIAAGPKGVELYEMISKLPGLRPGGFHVYDGHNHQESLPERDAAVQQLLAPVLEMRRTVEKKGLSVPRLVVGGTPTFPVFAKMELPGLECSPGTCILHDHGYGSHFADMHFTPAALLLTRVISKPTPTRLTLDLGYKALASDPPAEKRCLLLNVPDYKPVLQNEEHLVVETPAADQFKPGSEVFAVPYHICPTCALHRQAYVVENGRVTGQWDIVGRDRVLSI
jgi:D-serine deaminase-like pyridoxal phosphate-dependent protein